jgi:hypothetical protein
MKPTLLAIICICAISLMTSAHYTSDAGSFQARSSSVYEECWNWNGLDACQGQQTNVSDVSNSRQWQTPPRGT